MNFKEALIAHLSGEAVEYKGRSGWEEFPGSFRGAMLGEILDGECDKNEFRLAPRTITVNGVEVPAPESVAPSNDVEYFYPDFCTGFADRMIWSGHSIDARLFDAGLAYLNKDDAIARAKAMLLFSK